MNRKKTKTSTATRITISSLTVLVLRNPNPYQNINPANNILKPILLIFKLPLLEQETKI